MISIIDVETLDRIAGLSTPHMKAINEALEEAFPDQNLDGLYTAALAFHLSALLYALDPVDRPEAISSINSFLAKLGAGYKLVTVN